MQCVSEGLTLREAAKETGIAYRTSFIWRHKILSALKDVGCIKMEGIVEADETFFLFSEKGSRKIQNRKPRKRGGKATKRGINDEHIAVIVSADRHGEFIAEVAGRGRLTTKQIDVKIGKWIGQEVEVICTDSHRSYDGFAKKKKLKHVKINASKGQHVKDKIYHIQNINSTHSMIKDWMRRFKGGVGSDYLQNYMNWFRVQRKLDNNQENFIRYALTANDVFISEKNIKPHYTIS
jgi:IS1 family transposase